MSQHIKRDGRLLCSDEWGDYKKNGFVTNFYKKSLQGALKIKECHTVKVGKNTEFWCKSCSEEYYELCDKLNIVV